MNRNEIVEKLARDILETTQEPDHIDGNVDRDMEQLGDDVLAKCRELAHEFFDVPATDGQRDWIVPVIRDLMEKDDPDNIVTVHGKIRVRAADANAARMSVVEMMKAENTLQTTDPRIVWDYDGLPYDPEYGCVDGYEYVDFTFDVSDDDVEPAEVGIFNATYVSMWDGGVEARSACKFDAELMRVYDIEDSNVEGVENLDEEYIETEDGGKFDKSEVTICQ